MDRITPMYRGKSRLKKMKYPVNPVKKETGVRKNESVTVI
jgi:hypothetical protein